VTTPIPLESAYDERAYGGKAVALGVALRAGLPVPGGFALSTTLVDGVAAGDAAARASVEGLVARAGGRVAVRSSAVGEDSAAASFAGQHATVLDVRSEEGLLAAVGRVRASGHTPSALAYRRRLGVEGAPRMGVVVQRLVDADRAGVLFTKNPLTGADERVIEAAFGLGEAVVSGILTPDRYRIARSGAVLERTAGQKDVAIRPLPGGGAGEVPVEPHLVDALCLDDGHLRALHALAGRCEEAHEGHHDIEWAFVEGRLFLLQRRAITGKAPVTMGDPQRVPQTPPGSRPGPILPGGRG
jgi:pyruvate,water dikinase